MATMTDVVAECRTVGQLKRFLAMLPDELEIRTDFEETVFQFAVWGPDRDDPSMDPFLGMEEVELVEDFGEDCSP